MAVTPLVISNLLSNILSLSSHRHFSFWKSSGLGNARQKRCVCASSFFFQISWHAACSCMKSICRLSGSRTEPSFTLSPTILSICHVFFPLCPMSCCFQLSRGGLFPRIRTESADSRPRFFLPCFSVKPGSLPEKAYRLYRSSPGKPERFLPFLNLIPDNCFLRPFSAPARSGTVRFPSSPFHSGQLLLPQPNPFETFCIPVCFHTSLRLSTSMGT